LQSNDIWVFAEQRNSRILNVNFELLGKARELANKSGGRTSAVLCGNNLEKETTELFAAGADTVYLIEDELLIHYRPDMYPQVITQLARKYKPLVMLFGATTIGRDLAPAVAVRLNTGCSADCCNLDLDEQGNLKQIVPAFGGRVMATIITPNHRPQLATVRPGVFRNTEKRHVQGEIIRPAITLPEPKIKIKNVQWQPGKRQDIKTAKTIVAGGAGIRDDNGWEMINQLAAKLGGAVAGTRPAMDEKRISEAQMVGQSGHTVRPDLYIAAGISGDIQHMVGLQESRIIVAINRDPKAPIFKLADYGIVGDYREILPLFLDALEKKVRPSCRLWRHQQKDEK